MSYECGVMTRCQNCGELISHLYKEFQEKLIKRGILDRDLYDPKYSEDLLEIKKELKLDDCRQCFVGLFTYPKDLIHNVQ